MSKQNFEAYINKSAINFSKKEMIEIPHQSNLIFQILLQFNIYVAVAWSLTYGFHIIYNISDLWNIHGTIILFAYTMALAAESWRLYSGYSGNLRAKASDLTICLVLSPLLQFPLLAFLLLSAKTQLLVITILTAVMFSIMIFEFLLGFYTWRKLSYQ